jgi:hypothetical protein
MRIVPIFCFEALLASTAQLKEAPVFLSTTSHNRVSESHVGHPREGEDPGFSRTLLDFRLRGNDVHIQ